MEKATQETKDVAKEIEHFVYTTAGHVLASGSIEDYYKKVLDDVWQVMTGNVVMTNEFTALASLAMLAMEFKVASQKSKIYYKHFMLDEDKYNIVDEECTIGNLLFGSIHLIPKTNTEIEKTKVVIVPESITKRIYVFCDTKTIQILSKNNHIKVEVDELIHEALLELKQKQLMFEGQHTIIYGSYEICFVNK